ncbi:hypothetical protein F4680DRAFT_469950 [Xylaria scruposa]|nr:hypothetical protein F4680DRAFT_469950 [Xylaria scruposa]
MLNTTALSTPGDTCYGQIEDTDESKERDLGLTTALRTRDKLGWPSTITFCLAPLTSLLAAAFLVLLWSPTFRDSRPSISTTNWLSRSVTLSALVLRIGVDFLTAVTVSMLASLILESGTCAFHDLASISVMRVEAPSPWYSLLILKDSGKTSHRCLLLVLSLLCLGLQFSSTILFADFAPGRAIGNPRAMNYMYDIDYGWNTTAPLAQIGTADIYNATHFPSWQALFQSAWTQRPRVFPVFGENRQMITSPSGVDDSGYILTSFLPFDSSGGRTQVAKFEGLSWVLDSRVSCQRPRFLDIKVTPAHYDAHPNPSWYSFIGRLENSTDVEGLWFPANASKEIPFSCQHKTLFRPAPENGLGFGICQLQGLDTVIQYPDDKNEGQAVLQATESAGSLRSRLYPYKVTDSLPARGPAFLVIASTLNQNQTSHEAFTKLGVQFNSSLIVHNKTVEDLYFSLCYTSWESSIAHVEMATPSPLEEPSIKVKDGSLDINAVLHHYGVGNLSVPRAILSLKEPQYNRSVGYPIQQPATDRFISRWDFDTLSRGAGYIIDQQPSNQIKLVPNVEQDEYLQFFDSWPASAGNITTLFHYAAVGSNDETAKLTPESTRHPDPSYQAFFTTAMNKTNNSPALSLSALLTFISSSAYYEQFPVLDKKATGEVALFVNVSYPQSNKGLIAVISLVVGHWIVCFLVLYLFLSTSNFSRLGNSWANVAQVYGSATKDIIKNGTFASDGEVKELLRREGQGRRRVIIKNGGEDGERFEAVLTTETRRPVVKGKFSKGC